MKIEPTDATPTYRGFRLQALYILHRILLSTGEELIFQPEGNEDLDVFDANEELIEVIQVKSYESLVLSDLSSKTTDFFNRVTSLFEANDLHKATVINFGLIGPEMEAAWSSDQENSHNAKKTGTSSKQISYLI